MYTRGTRSTTSQLGIAAGIFTEIVTFAKVPRKQISLPAKDSDDEEYEVERITDGIIKIKHLNI